MNCAVHTDLPAAAFCRTCGKALCENCKRDVMGAIYCEPCIASRLQENPPPIPASAPVAAVPGAPSPGAALLLGFIPGVGAMYNSQFMKGFIHVLIFVMLIIGTSYHWSFGIMIPFFIVYMAFDAYKTAEAKRLGLPLPDPLGIDRMFGLQETQPQARAASSAPATQAAQPGTLGFDPILATGTTAQPAPAVQRGNEPIGAIVLIVLGVAILTGNVVRFSLHKFWPLILVSIGLWLAYKRIAPRA